MVFALVYVVELFLLYLLNEGFLKCINAINLGESNLYNLIYILMCFFLSQAQMQGWEGLDYKL